MASERRFLFSFAIADKEGNFTFMDTRATIDGLLEAGIEAVKRRVVEDLKQEGVYVETPVLLSAIQLDTILPPHFVELTTRARQSMEQVVKDYSKGKPTYPGTIQDIEDWLDSVRRER